MSIDKKPSNIIFLSLFLFFVFLYSPVVTLFLSEAICVKLGIQCEVKCLYLTIMVPLSIVAEYIIFVWTKKSDFAKKISNDYVYGILVATLINLLVIFLDVLTCIVL